MATEDQINKELEKTSNQVEIGTFAQIAALKDLMAELYQTQLQVRPYGHTGSGRRATEGTETSGPSHVA